MSKKIGLGKGFGSLLPENFDNSIILDKGERVQKIPYNQIKPDPNQPRKVFDKSSIEELSESIKRYGILQPLIVTGEQGEYSIIAGERRYHAAKLAKLTHLPVIVRSIEDLEKLEIGLIENMQRVDLSPIEQALSIAKLNEQFNVPMQEIAKRLGKANTTIVNTVRLLQLPEFARTALEKNQISEGHARTILSLNNDLSLQKYLLEQIIKHNWSVRQSEAYVKSVKQKSEGLKKPKAKTQTSDEKMLSKKYSADVKITNNSRVNSVKFSFKSNKDFTQFMDKL